MHKDSSSHSINFPGSSLISAGNSEYDLITGRLRNGVKGLDFAFKNFC